MSVVAELSARDREFVSELRKQIQFDLSNIDVLTKAREYEIYKEAFDKLIGYVTSYRPLLTAIKAEYEEVVDSIIRGHREAQSLEMKVESIAAVMPNLQNYKRRCAELESRIESLRAQEQQAQAAIDGLREARLRAREQRRQEVEAREAARKAKPPLRRRLPPGMTLDEVTDTASLAAEKARVDRQLRQLRHKAETQYVSRERTDQLRQTLLDKIRRKEELEAALQVERLRQQIVRLAGRAADEFEQCPPPGLGLAGAILLAARRQWPSVRRRPSAGGDLSERVPDSNADVSGADPARRAEADKAAECLDRFRELLTAGDLPAAAGHAANSYRGLLRTMDALQKFKHLEARCPGLLLAYCEALLATVPQYEGRLGAELSFECVAEALARDRVDLVEHWTTNGLLTLTEPIGDLLADHGDCRPGQAQRSFELAHVVFDRTAAASTDSTILSSGVRAVECLVRAGRTEAAVAYGVATAGLGAGQFRQLLHRQPSVELALHLVGYGCLTVGDAVGCFYAMEAWVELGWLADSLIQKVAEESGLMTQQAALKLMEDNAEVPASVWTEIARQAPEDMRHLNELFTSSVVYDAFSRSLSTMQREFSLH